VETRRFLEANGVDSRWVDVDEDPLVRHLGGTGGPAPRYPLVLFGDGSRLEGPPRYMRPRLVRSLGDLAPDDALAYEQTSAWRAALADRVGLPTRAAHERYDVLVAGGGPAGLTAALYAASEGLRTLLVEVNAPGGQAATSSRIENYPGFPDGIGGAELAASTYAQAVRLGAEVLVGVEIWGPRPPEGDDAVVVTLSNGATVRARAGVAAMGVHYRRLDAPGVEALIGAGVSYGSAPGEAAQQRGRDVVVVGGANSAGQAALHLADHARRVTVVVRAGALADGMSDYLVQRVEAHPRIAVRTRSRVVAARGEQRLEELEIADAASGERSALAADAAFILIGAQPITAGVEGWLCRDDHGFLVTGPDLLAQDGDRRWWPHPRDPLFLESSQAGVFVAGDLRHGSVKRVASAVGEGAMAVALVHEYLSRFAPPSRP